jgi:cytidylate kinase
LNTSVPDTIIIVCGRICSGKSTIAKLLSDHLSYPLGSFGGYLLSYCFENKLPTDREHLQKLGQQKIQNDPHQFVKDVIKFYNPGSTNLVLDGVRHRIVYDIIKKLSNKFYSVYVEADLKTRYQRYVSRHHIKYEKFISVDTHPVELETERLKPLSDLVIDTTAPVENVLLKFIKKVQAK